MTRVVFNITVNYQSQNLNLTAQLIFKNATAERYKVSGKNRSITLQNNRPALMTMNSEKGITWKLIEGQMPNGDLMYEIIKSLESKLMTLEKNTD